MKPDETNFGTLNGLTYLKMAALGPPKIVPGGLKPDPIGLRQGLKFTGLRASIDLKKKMVKVRHSMIITVHQNQNAQNFKQKRTIDDVHLCT